MLRVAKIIFGLSLFVGVLASAFVVWAIGGPAPLAVATGPTEVVAVFRGDTLHDLARLLRPVNYWVPSNQPGNTSLKLRDAIYVGADNGKARLLSVWLTQDSSDDSLLLSAGDAEKRPSDVADSLAQGPMMGLTFAVIPLEVSWQNWTLTVSRSGESIVKGPPAASTQLQKAISGASSVIMQTNTRAVAVPIGYGQGKTTAWQPWFNAASIVIEIQPVPGNPSSSQPNIDALNGEAGFIIGDSFLNNVFSNELKDRYFGTKTDQGSYHARDLQFAADVGTLVVSGLYIEQAPPATVRMQAQLTDADFKTTAVKPEKIDCGTLGPLDCAALHVQVDSVGVVLTRKIKAGGGTKLLPEDEQNLGNFSIGSKELNGIARLYHLRAIKGSVVLVSTIRLKGGRLS
jgi:hypothetical protein